MFSRFLGNKQCKSKPPTSFGGLSFMQPEKSVFLLRINLLYSLFLTLFFFSSSIQAALLLTQPPSILEWSTSVVPVQANVQVLRYEKIGFYRYQPSASSTFVVREGNFANQDSLTGTPLLLESLPAPLDENRNPLLLNSSVPLIEASDYEFGTNEPLFVVAQGPILPPEAFNIRSADSVRYIAVSIDIDNGATFIITLVETANGSGDFVGYLQPNLPGSPVVIPPGSSISIRYDDYGDVPDSETINAPWFVDPSVYDNIEARKRGVTGNSPITPSYEMFLSKQALRSTAVVGDFLAYELRLENTGNTLLSNLEIIDSLPKGFRYQKKSTRIDGAAGNDPLIDPAGQILTFPLANLSAGASVTLRYVVEVTVASDTGEAINYAQAHNGGARSNPANALVIVEQPFFNDRAFLLGRVMVGACGDGSSRGLEGVRLYLEDGSSVITDKHGRWHLEGVKPGTHVLQLDTLTLGPRYSIQNCEDNTRKAGNLTSRFVNVQGGTLWREDWYLSKAWSTDANIEQSLSSKRNTVDGTVEIELPVRMGEIKYQGVQTQIFIPEQLKVIPGTAKLNGYPIKDLTEKDGVHQLNVQPEGYFAKYTLSLTLAVNADVLESHELEVRAESVGKSVKGETFSVSSSNLLTVKGMRSKDNIIEIHPKFSSMSVELSAEDKKSIDEAVVNLKERPNLFLHVAGHTDNQPIRYRAGRAINDNYALSEVRAKAVAEYVASLLAIDMQRVTVEGKGPDEPLADNSSAEGRAKNRRVSIEFRFTEKASDALVDVLVGYSGINNDKGIKTVHTEKDQSSASDAIQTSNEKQGFVNLQEGMTLAQPVFSATALLDSKLNVKLLIDEQEVPAGRIGMKMLDPSTNFTRYTWVGLELENIGDHRIELQGLDSFGVVRFSEKITLRRSANIKTIRMVSVAEHAGNIADGRTPVKIKIALIDEFDKPITTGAQLFLVSGTLKPLNTSQNNNPLESRNNVVNVGADGFIHFEPVGTAGTYRVRLSSGDIVSDYMEIPVAPDLREWILVGFAEGTLGYNTLKGNMNALKDEEEHLYTDGDAAFFARGKVKGEWLLTVAYDNRRMEDDSPLLQRIDPQQWYVLYGDDTIRGHDAPSRKKLYLRMEKTDFYALFGDYDTGFNVTELSRYQRTLTGAKVEWNGRNVSASGFAAQTNQGFIRDDIAADGTSGLYRLSRQGLVFGSEEVYIETRDRFTNEVISSVPMVRFVDYNLDYIDGTLYFRSPVFVQDANFNPQRIVVLYEVDSGVEEIVGGGRVTVYDTEKKLVVGLTAVDDATTGANGTLGGLDVTWNPNQAHSVKAEVAGTQQKDILNNSVNSDAGLVEYSYKSAAFDSRVRVEEQEGGFGMGQLASDDGDIRSAQADARYRLSEELALSGSASRQELLSNDNQRDVVETRLEYLQSNWKAYGGLRHSEDNVADEVYQSQKLIAGGQRHVMDQRLLLSARGETDIDSSENVDYPNLLSLGSDYRLNNKVSLFANQDFSWGQERRSHDTRLGARASPWQGATLSSDVSRSQDEYGPRLLAHAGLFQTIPISSQWTADVGLDRSQTLRDSDNNNVNVDEVFDPRRALAQGTRNDDYTAASAGAGYRNAQWQWTNRLELRRADTDDKWTVMSGFQHRLDETDTMAGRLLHFDQRVHSGSELRSSEADFSYSRRPLSDSWYWLNRSRLIVDELVDVQGEQAGHRIVNNTHLNFVMEQRHQLSMQYGARYVRDTIDALRFTGYSDLIGAEYRYDITEKWDAGFRGSILSSHNSNIRMDSFGVMAGYSPIKDVWISLGYNFKGFYDQDFSAAETRVEGFVLNFRIKLDQEGVKSMREGGSE